MIRVITGEHKRESCRHILKKFRILTLTNLTVYSRGVMLYKNVYSIYYENLKQNCGIHGHNKRNKLDLHTRY